MKKASVVVAALIILAMQPALAKESRAHKVTRWITAGVFFVPFIALGVAYAPVIAPVCMYNAWESVFFEHQRDLDAIQTECDENRQAPTSN